MKYLFMALLVGANYLCIAQVSKDYAAANKKAQQVEAKMNALYKSLLKPLSQTEQKLIREE